MPLRKLPPMDTSSHPNNSNDTFSGFSLGDTVYAPSFGLGHYKLAIITGFQREEGTASVSFHADTEPIYKDSTVLMCQLICCTRKISAPSIVMGNKKKKRKGARELNGEDTSLVDQLTRPSATSGDVQGHRCIDPEFLNGSAHPCDSEVEEQPEEADMRKQRMDDDDATDALASAFGCYTGFSGFPLQLSGAILRKVIRAEAATERLAPLAEPERDHSSISSISQLLASLLIALRTMTNPCATDRRRVLLISEDLQWLKLGIFCWEKMMRLRPQDEAESGGTGTTARSTARLSGASRRSGAASLRAPPIARLIPMSHLSTSTLTSDSDEVLFVLQPSLDGENGKCADTSTLPASSLVLPLLSPFGPSGDDVEPDHFSSIVDIVVPLTVAQVRLLHALHSIVVVSSYSTATYDAIVVGVECGLLSSVVPSRGDTSIVVEDAQQRELKEAATALGLDRPVYDSTDEFNPRMAAVRCCWAEHCRKREGLPCRGIFTYSPLLPRAGRERLADLVSTRLGRRCVSIDSSDSPDTAISKLESWLASSDGCILLVDGDVDPVRTHLLLFALYGSLFVSYDHQGLPLLQQLWRLSTPATRLQGRQAFSFSHQDLQTLSKETASSFALWAPSMLRYLEEQPEGGPPAVSDAHPHCMMDDLVLRAAELILTRDHVPLPRGAKSNGRKRPRLSEKEQMMVLDAHEARRKPSFETIPHSTLFRAVVETMRIGTKAVERQFPSTQVPLLRNSETVTHFLLLTTGLGTDGEGLSPPGSRVT